VRLLLGTAKRSLLTANAAALTPATVRMRAVSRVTSGAAGAPPPSLVLEHETVLPPLSATQTVVVTVTVAVSLG
jgi:hypothetical protein